MPSRNGHSSSDRSSLACRFGSRRRSTATTSECTETKRCGPQISANACRSLRGRDGQCRARGTRAWHVHAAQNMPRGGRSGPRQRMGSASDRQCRIELSQVVSAGPLGVLGRSAYHPLHIPALALPRSALSLAPSVPEGSVCTDDLVFAVRFAVNVSIPIAGLGGTLKQAMSRDGLHWLVFAGCVTLQCRRFSTRP